MFVPHIIYIETQAPSNSSIDEKGIARTNAIDDFPTGYPRFSALIAAEDSFQIYRRFANLRTRLLLYKQDSLSVLEKQLESIDFEEKAPLFLGSRRLDRNQERKDVLSEINVELLEYDDLLERNARMNLLKPAQPREVTSLPNWINGTGSIARDESEYLSCQKDLLTLKSSDDGPLSRLEDAVEDAFIRLCRGLYRRSTGNEISADSQVFIASSSLNRRIARALMAALVTVLLLAPMLVCNFVPDVVVRVVIVVISVITFIATVSGITKARSIEIFVASATYAAVLTVFITNGS
ncbi:hypothetical protein BBP40_001642 [Aspergillus hancockii]|nr:hypothetical protein BBP40_001642 [Aspergillus hancockii]